MTISRLRTIWYRIVAAAVATAVPVVVVISTLAMPADAQTSGFGDVPKDAYFATPVADLHAEGVFNDTLCEEGFCPGVHIDRRIMAVWTIRVLDGEDPPAITQSRFDDVDPDSYHAPFIERMAELRVTRGCGDPSRFCPDRNVTRAEMAAFLSRAFNLLDGPNPGFDDVPDGAWYASDVAKLAASGITVGCGGTRFCPDRNVTRAEMATFLWRATDDSEDDTLEALPEFLSAEQADLSRHEIEVFYCGNNSNYDLKRDVTQFNSMVKTFFEHQSGYERSNGDTVGTSVTFFEGQKMVNVSGVQWSTDTLQRWYDIANESHDKGIEWRDPCREEAKNRSKRHVLVIADIKPCDTSYCTYGFALVKDGGSRTYPVIVVSENHRDPRDNNGDGDFTDDIDYTARENFLATVAHELGHFFYNWQHPDKDEKNQDKSNPTREQLLSLMSTLSLGSQRDLSSDASDLVRAYVACYQRKLQMWVDDTVPESECRDEIELPDPVGPLDITPGDGFLDVSWTAPNHGSASITEYKLYYRPSGGKQWHSVSIRQTERRISQLANGTVYEVAVQAKSSVGVGGWSPVAEATPRAEPDMPPPLKRVTLKIGQTARGSEGVEGACTSVHCRWLHIEIENFDAGPHTLVCAHNGVEQAGFGRGAWRSVEVSTWPSTDDCLFGYPGSEVFVIVDPELRDGFWRSGIYSNTVVWPNCTVEPDKCPDDDDLELRISWGSDDRSRSNCPSNTECRNLSYEYIGDWPSQPYSVECWGNGRRTFGPFQWSGRPDTGCYYSGGTAQVVINGVRSNELQWEGSEAEVPDRPTVRATVDETTIEATWSADDNGSRIERWHLQGPNEVDFRPTITNHVWRNLAPGRYTLRVRAENSKGWSQWGQATVTVVGNEPALRVWRGGPG